MRNTPSARGHVASATCPWSRARPLALIACALALGGCSSCSSKSDAPAASASVQAVELAPVPAPAGLLADVYVPHPTKTWTALREAVGGPILLLPASYQMLSATMLGLAPQVAGLVDEDVAVVGAVVDGGDAQPHVVFGLHVRNPRELIANLVTGSDAKFRATDDAKSGVKLLEPVPGRASQDMHLGVVGSYLVASADADALTSAGPYVGRTLPKRPMPDGGLVVVANHKALAGPVASRVKAAWQAYKTRLVATDQSLRVQHGGRAPDFADPSAVILGAGTAVDALVEVLATSDELRLVVDPLEGRLEACLELTPEKNGAAAELVDTMVVGPFDGMKKLPVGTAIALESRTSKASRQSSAQTTGDALARLFGDRLGAADRKKLDATLADLAAGRGDDQTFALVSGSSGSGAVMRLPVTDAEAFQRGVKSGLGLLSLPAFSAPLERFVGKASVKVSTATVPGVDGKVQRALVSIKPGGSAPERQSLPAGKQATKLEALWTVAGGTAYGALASDAGPLLVELLAANADPGKSLAADAPVAKAIDRNSQATTLELIADPQKVGMTRGGGAALSPIVIAVGRGKDQAWLRLELPQAALRGMLRFAMHR